MITIPPDIIPHTEWRDVTQKVRESPHWPEILEAAQNAANKPGWNPKTVKLDEDEVVLDYSFHRDSNDLSSFCVAKVSDHPYLSTLPSNAPRTVKHILRKETRLRYLRSSEAWGFICDLQKAKDSAQKYNDDAEAKVLQEVVSNKVVKGDKKVKHVIIGALSGVVCLLGLWGFVTFDLKFWLWYPMDRFVFLLLAFLFAYAGGSIGLIYKQLKD